MTFVITQSCCGDAVCAAVCPVNCIHPTPADPDFGHSEMLYIDPNRCIDCAACAEVCPVNAIYAGDELPADQAGYAAINAEYHRAKPHSVALPTPSAPRRVARPLAVAVVGAGPSGFYAAAELLQAGPDVTVSLIDRLPTPYGLVRAGVAPDHQDTKLVADTFAACAVHPRLTTYLNVDVGKDISHRELAAHHHAVVYATGATEGRRLGVPGENLPGSFTSAEMVGWYNGHPDHTDLAVTAGHATAVLVGNGNVALDVARVLLTGSGMRTTDIADHALDVIADSAIRDVVILGRRGPQHAAFSFGQLLALTQLEGVDVVVDAAELADVAAPADLPHPAAFATNAKLELLGALAQRRLVHDNRIHLRFDTAIRAITGADRVDGVVTSSPTRGEITIAAGLVVSCIGFDSRPVAGVPFDADLKRVPNTSGRVLDGEGQVVAGHYVTGWIKRGPTGVIGTNKRCALETVTAVLDDHDRGLLRPPNHTPADFAELVAAQAINRRGWLSIDEHERARGRQLGRPRSKAVHWEELVHLGRITD